MKKREEKDRGIILGSYEEVIFCISEQNISDLASDPFLPFAGLWTESWLFCISDVPMQVTAHIQTTVGDESISAVVSEKC